MAYEFTQPDPEMSLDLTSSQPDSIDHGRSLGYVALFVGDAQKYQPFTAFDVDGVAELIREQGASGEDLPNLTVIAHHRYDEPERARQGVLGWYNYDSSAVLTDEDSKVETTFSHAIHVLIPSPWEELNETIIHESWHIYTRATGQEEERGYTPATNRIVNALEQAEERHIPGAAFARRTYVAYKWRRSPEERSAEAFAERTAETNSFVGKPETIRTPQLSIDAAQLKIRHRML